MTVQVTVATTPAPCYYGSSLYRVYVDIKPCNVALILTIEYWGGYVVVAHYHQMAGCVNQGQAKQRRQDWLLAASLL